MCAQKLCENPVPKANPAVSHMSIYLQFQQRPLLPFPITVTFSWLLFSESMLQRLEFWSRLYPLPSKYDFLICPSSIAV